MVDPLTGKVFKSAAKHDTTAGVSTPGAAQPARPATTPEAPSLMKSRRSMVPLFSEIFVLLFLFVVILVITASLYTWSDS